LCASVGDENKCNNMHGERTKIVPAIFQCCCCDPKLCLVYCFRGKCL